MYITGGVAIIHWNSHVIVDPKIRVNVYYIFTYVILYECMSKNV